MRLVFPIVAELHDPYAALVMENLPSKGKRCSAAQHFFTFGDRK